MPTQQSDIKSNEQCKTSTVTKKPSKKHHQSISASEWTLYIDIHQPLNEKLQSSKTSIKSKINEDIIDFITKIFGRVGYKFNPKTLNYNQTYTDRFGGKYMADGNAFYEIVSVKNIPMEVVELLNSPKDYNKIIDRIKYEHYYYGDGEITKENAIDDFEGLDDYKCYSVISGEPNSNGQNKTVLIELFVMNDC